MRNEFSDIERKGQVHGFGCAGTDDDAGSPEG
jgi:hypothetical protein